MHGIRTIAMCLVIFICGMGLSAEDEMTFIIEDMEIEISKINQYGDIMKFEFMILSHDKDREFVMQLPRFRMFDGEGNEYKAHSAKLGSKKGNIISNPKIMLIKKVPVRAELIFKSIPELSVIKMLEAWFSLPDGIGGFSSRFRDMPVPFVKTSTEKATKSAQKTTLDSKAPIYELDAFSIRINSIRNIGGKVIINLLMKNEDRDDEIELMYPGVRMFDNQGNEYKSSGGKLGSRLAGPISNPKKYLIAGVPMNAQLKMKAPDGLNSIKILELKCRLKSQGQIFNPRFEDLTLPYEAPETGNNIDIPKFAEREIAVDEDLTVSITGASIEAKKLKLDFVFENSGADKNIRMNIPKSRLIDPKGNEIMAYSGVIGTKKGYQNSGIKVKLVKGIPVKGNLIFKIEDPEKFHFIAGMEVNFNGINFRIKNIGIEK